jgi:hypothetical protein
MISFAPSAVKQKAGLPSRKLGPSALKSSLHDSHSTRPNLRFVKSFAGILILYPSTSCLRSSPIIPSSPNMDSPRPEYSPSASASRYDLPVFAHLIHDCLGFTSFDIVSFSFVFYVIMLATGALDSGAHS